MDNPFMILGPALAAIGIYLIWVNRRFQKEAVTLRGTVVEIRTRPARRNRKAHYPVVSFIDPQTGRPELFEAPNPYEADRFTIGSPVELLYGAANGRRRILMNDFPGLWGLALMLTSAGMLFTLLAILLQMKS